MNAEPVLTKYRGVSADVGQSGILLDWSNMMEVDGIQEIMLDEVVIVQAKGYIVGLCDGGDFGQSITTFLAQDKGVEIDGEAGFLHC